VRAVSRSYPRIESREVRVILLHAQERILPEVAESLALFAQEQLRRRGVEIRLGTRLASATGNAAILAGGEAIPTRTLVSTVPASPHPLIDALPLPKAPNGRLLTDGHLRVQGQTHVWALGDCARIATPDGTVVPPTAQHATRQASVVATNILSSLRGGEARVFAFKGLGKMGSLGHRSAVAEILGLKVSGFLAWWLWRTIYLMKMPGWGRRLKVATSWTLDLFLAPELVNLRLQGSEGVSQEHFEPGEDVFREGELGDRLFIILKGEAEVRRDQGGRPEVLARLGPGQCFGEMALVNMATRNATVRCLTSLDVLSLPRKEFAVLAANLPDLRRSFEQLASERAASSAPTRV
jgi:NADH dehydrogenase